LLLCGELLHDHKMTQVALDSLRWLAKIQRADLGDGHFVPIGSNGFYIKDGERAHFDQQPVEAQTTISACLEAYHLTKDELWFEGACNTFEWFLGRNDLNLSQYDPATGGCRDGLRLDSLNQNQGAESTLAFLQSLLELKLAYNGRSQNGQNHEQTTISTSPSSSIESDTKRFDLALSHK
jgi:hypothetical protein